MNDTREQLAMHIEAIRADLREHEITLELMEELYASMGREEPASASLGARVYRRLTNHSDWEHTKGLRADLHRHVAEGNVLAAEMLELLSDDPFWRAP